MLEIDGIVVDPTIPDLQFRCNLGRCKGACCTIPGGRGAPLLDAEIEELHKAFPAAKKHLPPEHVAVIERDGLFEGTPGDYVTTCVGNKACVFVTYEDGIAKCSLEKAYFAGETEWRKPVSCHLFPLRIDPGMQERIRFEYLVHCEPAFDAGESSHMYLIDFVKDALVRVYGEPWYERFSELCRQQRIEDKS